MEKKRFKSQEAKKVLASHSEQVNQLHSKMQRDGQDVQQRNQQFEQLQKENQQLRGTLNVKKNGNLMMNALMRGLK